jgi:transposase
MWQISSFKILKWRGGAVRPVTLLGGQEESRQLRFWAYIGEAYHYSAYGFTESRARDGPASFLQGFKGYLHADGYGGYDHIFLGSNDAVSEVACWAHARRKFFEAIHSSPRDVRQLLEWIRQLYDIEERASTWTEAARAALRQHQAEPVLDRIEAYLAQLERRALPKSVLAKAVSYEVKARSSNLNTGAAGGGRSRRTPQFASLAHAMV